VLANDICVSLGSLQIRPTTIDLAYDACAVLGLARRNNMDPAQPERRLQHIKVSQHAQSGKHEAPFKGASRDVVYEAGGGVARRGAIAAGEVEMAMGGIPLLTNRRLWLVTDTITRTSHAPLEFLLIIDEKTWQKLPPKDQVIIKEVACREELRIRDEVAGVEAKTAEFAREKNMRIQSLTGGDVANCRACSADVQES
jgi:C4-dicarboxylate-binding protein DctP